MIKNIFFIIFATFFLNGCFNSSPSEEFAIQSLKDTLSKDNDIYTVSDMKVINGWVDEKNKNKYTIKISFKKNLNSSYENLVLTKATKILDDLFLNEDIKDIKNPIEITYSYKYRIFDEKSARFIEDSQANKELYRSFISSCTPCLEFIKGVDKNNLLSNIQAASLGQAIVFLKEEKNIPISNAKENSIYSELELNFRKTDKGWDLIK